MLDLAIKGGTVVTADGEYPADVGIEGSQITLIARPGGLPAAKREINAEGMLVLPGAIDIHFHVRAPGHPERGTFITESQSAAAGGVTTFLEMPISVPCCATREVLEMRRDLGEAESLVNFGLYGAPGLLKRDEILGMAEAGACGFKIFTHGIQPGREAEFQGLCLPDENDIYRVLEMTKETGLLTSFHAENERLIQLFEGRVRATGRVDPGAFLESRPDVVEALSVAQLTVLCEAVGARVHIAHVSGEWPLQMLQAGQARGLPMTGETCPHYLLFTGDDLRKHGPYAMIKPPMRETADQEALWKGLRDGSLLAIATDHSPFTVAEKERGMSNIWQSAIGAPGVELLVPFTISEALRGRYSLSDAVRFIATQPAKLFNLANKGEIRVGADADIAIYAPQEATVVNSQTWLSKANQIGKAYDGIPMQGHVAHTIVNGSLVYSQGQITAEPGTGRFVRPSLS